MTRSQILEGRSERQKTRATIRNLIQENKWAMELPVSSDESEEEEVQNLHPRMAAHVASKVQEMVAPPVDRAAPSYSTFYRARWDKQFNDVATRAKHFHCRCPTCSTLQALGLQKWTCQLDRDEHIQNVKDHRSEVTNWRILEKFYQN